MLHALIKDRFCAQGHIPTVVQRVQRASCCEVWEDSVLEEVEHLIKGLCVCVCWGGSFVSVVLGMDPSLHGA